MSMSISCTFPLALAPLISLAALTWPVGRAVAQPQPGDVFREYRYTSDTIIEADTTSTQDNPKFLKRKAISMRERSLDIWDLEDAVRAEVALELWGGHAGTSGHGVRVNGGAWLSVPQIKGTPTDPHCYQRLQMGSAIVPIPIAQLKQGRNVLQFRAGKQVCHDFNWGIYKIYAFTVRVYYGPGKPRPEGRVIGPADGSRIGDNPWLAAEVRGKEANLAKTEFTGASVVRVDYVGRYDDFNWEGDGVARQWHGILEQGEVKRHLGTATAAPWKAAWDTRWIPDQAQPIEIAARVTDAHGIVYLTPAVKVTLERKGRSVKLYPATDVPEKFGVRVGLRKACTIEVGDDPRKANAARLVLSTWAGEHADGIGLNDKKIVDRVGTADYYSFDAVDFDPRAVVKKGKNTFFIFSNTQQHHAEVHWPGPALLLEYGKPPPRPTLAAR
jgi:hypothetical protein